MTPLECWQSVEAKLRFGPATQEGLAILKGMDRVTVAVGLRYGEEHSETGLRVSIRCRRGSVVKVFALVEIN